MPNTGDIIKASDFQELVDLINNSSGSKGIIGEIITYFGDTAPEGTLICDGSEVSREAYSELFRVIGTREGAGDGTTTFNLPDLRDRWIKSSGNENSVGDKISEGLPNISGRIATISDAARNSSSSFMYYTGRGGSHLYDGGGYGAYVYFYINAHNANAIYGNSTHVTPNSIALLSCIRYE